MQTTTKKSREQYTRPEPAKGSQAAVLQQLILKGLDNESCVKAIKRMKTFRGSKVKPSHVSFERWQMKRRGVRLPKVTVTA
jgi:hypothetical protein